VNGNGHPPSERRVAGLPRNVFVLGMVSLFNDVGSEMIFAIYPLFLATVLGAGAEIIGLIEGIAESMSNILKTFSGWLSDRVSRRKSFVFSGYALSNTVQPLMGLTTAWPQLLVLRSLDRLGKGTRESPRDALVADSASQEEYGRSFGFQRSMDSLGGVLGPILAFAILAYFHYLANPGAPLISYFVSNSTTPATAFRWVFFLAAVPNLLAVALVLLVREKPHLVGRVGKPRLSLAGFDSRFKLYLLAVVVLGLSQLSYTFMILRSRSAGVAVPLIPLLYMFFQLIYAATAAPAGVVSDRIGRRRVLTMGYGVFILMSVGWIFVATPLGAAGLFGLYGLFHGLTDGVQRAFAADLSGGERRGTGLGLYHTGRGLALLPASAIAGVLWAVFGPAAAFIFAGGVASVGLILLSFV